MTTPRHVRTESRSASSSKSNTASPSESFPPSSEMTLACQNCGSFRVVRRNPPSGEPQSNFLCQECGQRGELADFLEVSANLNARRRA